MRVPTANRSAAAMSSAAMTPLIDVVFQLLIFFMCASTGHLREQLLPADLGTGASGDLPAPIEKPLGEVWIQVTWKAGQTVPVIEGTPYHDWPQFEQVVRTLAETALEIPVILEIDGAVPVGDVIRVYDLCRAVGFQSLSFAADPLKAGESDSL
jgi:biopolymer transport protein ExbD